MFLGRKVDAAKLAQAVKATAFANMQKQEREKGFTPEPFDGDPTLVVLSKTFR